MQSVLWHDYSGQAAKSCVSVGISKEGKKAFELHKANIIENHPLPENDSEDFKLAMYSPVLS